MSHNSEVTLELIRNLFLDYKAEVEKIASGYSEEVRKDEADREDEFGGLDMSVQLTHVDMKNQQARVAVEFMDQIENLVNPIPLSLIDQVYGVGKSTRVLATIEDQKAYESRMSEIIDPLLKENQRARTESWRKAQDHFVD